MKVCLTGGIACGKSLLSRYLNEFGVETIDADDLVHELVPENERRRLAKIVFRDPAARKALEARLHPIVRRRIAEWQEMENCAPRESSPTAGSSIPRAQVCADAPPHIRIAVIPLVFEVHWDSDYDIIVCVVSSREKQIERMTAMRGYTREEAEARLAAQMDVSEKAAKSQYVIRNDGSPGQLKEEASRLVAWLKEQMK